MADQLRAVLGVALVAAMVTAGWAFNYMYFSDTEVMRFGHRTHWGAGDTVMGQIRTNDCFGITQYPVFGLPPMMVDDACLPDWWNGDYLLVPPLEFPSEALWLRQAATWRGHFLAEPERRARVRFGDHLLRVWWAPAGAPFDTADHIDIQLGATDAVFFDCPQVDIAGTVHTVLFFGCSGRIGLEDNVLYASAYPVNGVAPAGHPEKLAVIAEGEIKVLNTIRNGRNNSSGLGNSQTNPSLTDIALSGLYVAMNEEFTFEQQNDPDSGYVFCTPPQGGPDDRGTIYIFGGLYQKRRGYVRRSTCQSTGYYKQYRFDPELLEWDTHLLPFAETQVEPQTIYFPDTPPGDTATDTVRVNNPMMLLQVYGILTGGVFSAELLVSAPDTQQTIVVRFHPPSVGSYQRTLSFYVNPGTQYFSVPLSGTARALDAGPETPGVPRELALGASPNPFNAQTQLTLALPQAGEVELALYDLTGRQVAVLQKGFLAAGTHTVAIDGAGLASGLYFVRLESSSYQRAIKLALIR